MNTPANTTGLVAIMEYSAVEDAEFNRWYNTEHLPERQRIPGFLTCERWISIAPDKLSIGSYDLESPDVLQSEPYLAVAFENATPWTKKVTGMCTRILRVISEQRTPGNVLAPSGAGGLLFSALNIAPELEPEFEEWCDTEHLPALAGVSGVLAARRFVGEGASHRHVFLYHLTSPEVVQGGAWKTAARTPWSERIVPQYRDRVRIVCRRPD
ncbi:hypothetical protein [Bosea sp. (in: a-proteobacteria)]|uniref:hypothetical protein n=1 Tax=Bosea sp. (in: a-proteobacteria) TaxID=1871050 RepID=UPI0026050034|nr:hypothetical protein [Bosea sp. (in: a-proteobacteria)]MCO5091847.1 hypothetical protein [Bosea sp. (in: a-proteobacteria)]